MEKLPYAPTVQVMGNDMVWRCKGPPKCPRVVKRVEQASFAGNHLFNPKEYNVMGNGRSVRLPKANDGVEVWGEY